MLAPGGMHAASGHPLGREERPKRRGSLLRCLGAVVVGREGVARALCAKEGRCVLGPCREGRWWRKEGGGVERAE